LEAILRLAHPLVPFITEELWQKVSLVAGIKKADYIGEAAYPQSQPGKIDPVAEAHVAKLKTLVDACRNLRGEMKVSPATRLPLFVLGDSPFMSTSAPVIKALAKLSEVKVFEDEAAWAAAAQAAPVAVVGDARICLHMEVDVAAEKLRLGKEATRLDGELVKVKARLANEAFVAKVPPTVLEQERKRLTDFTATLEKIREQLSRLG
jgi:valyl-tRNA synthetase